MARCESRCEPRGVASRALSLSTMSGVVSSAHPDAAALRSATALEEALQRGGLARRAEHTRRCAAVLKQLEALSVEWVRRVALALSLIHI